MQQVDMIITDLGVFARNEQGLQLIEIYSDITVGMIRSATAAEFTVSPDIRVIAV